MPENLDENKNKNNVKDLKEAKIKKIRSESRKEDRTPLADIYNIWLGVISGQAKNFPAFPLNLITCETGSKERLWYYVEEKKICRSVSEAVIASYIRDYSGIHFSGTEFWLGVTEKSNDLVRYCRSRMPLSDRPKAYAFLRDDINCFNKLDFNPTTGVATPLFDEFIGRLSNAKAFEIFIGSLFEERSDRQQYLWIYGEGQNGKGSLARLLAKIFGQSYRALEPRRNDDRFWSTQLLDTRIGVFEDCNATTFTTAAWFKSLTGDDQIVMEYKGKSHFTTKINTKFIVMSNEKPNLSSEKADLRRIIFCDLKPITGALESDYENRLWDEAPGIVGRCITAFLNHVSTNESGLAIPINDEGLQELTAQEDDSFEYLFSRYFDDSSPSFECSAQEFGSVMREIFGGGSKNKSEEGKFRRWLERAKGVFQQRGYRDKKLVRFYPGIRKKMCYI